MPSFISFHRERTLIAVGHVVKNYRHQGGVPKQKNVAVSIICLWLGEREVEVEEKEEEEEEHKKYFKCSVKI